MTTLHRARVDETERSTIDSVTDNVFSATELRRAYAEGWLRPSRLADAVLDRLGAGTVDNVWISTVAPDELRRRADALDACWATRADLPLYGVPFAVKDNIDVAGLPTTAGCPDYAYHPARTAPVVQRLLDAGAMLVGKTNLDQFATGLTGARSPYGACQSVFGGGLISGGSSSGSAVAVAAGLVAFSLGTDTAGSGRVPAALNGIVGVKPTRGLLSTLGVVPACRSLDCVSIFAGDVAGAAAVLRAARGLVPADPWGRAGGAAAREPGTLRVGIPRADDLEFFGDAGQQRRFAAGVERFSGLVAARLPVDLGPLLEAGDLLYRGPWVAERLADLGDFLREHPDSVLPVTRRVLETGWQFTAADAFRALHRLQDLRACTRRLWESVDVLVLPTVGTTYTLDEIAADPVGRNLNLGRYTQFANLLDLAAVTIPNGMTADRRPASLTLLGPAFSDATLVRLAAALQQAVGAALPEEVAPVASPAGTPSGVGPGGVDTVPIAVVGLHLRGEPRNGELTARSATLIGPAVTAACYRLYRLPTADGGSLPGLVRTGTLGDGRGIDVELWRLPTAAVGALLAGVPAPLSLGRVRLADGSEVLGFLCEAYAAGPDAEDITAAGGWRAYRAAARALTKI